MVSTMRWRWPRISSGMGLPSSGTTTFRNAADRMLTDVAMAPPVLRSSRRQDPGSPEGRGGPGLRRYGGRDFEMAITRGFRQAPHFCQRLRSRAARGETGEELAP